MSFQNTLDALLRDLVLPAVDVWAPQTEDSFGGSANWSSTVFWSGLELLPLSVQTRPIDEPGPLVGQIIDASRDGLVGVLDRPEFQPENVTLNPRDVVGDSVSTHFEFSAAPHSEAGFGALMQVPPPPPAPGTDLYDAPTNSTSVSALASDTTQVTDSSGPDGFAGGVSGGGGGSALPPLLHRAASFEYADCV